MVLVEGSALTFGSLVDEPVVDLRVDVDARCFAAFGSRTTDSGYVPLGDSYPMRFAHYRGARIGLFSLGASPDAGHADFSDFAYVDR